MVSAVIFVATSCVSPLTGFAFWETNLAYEGESIYNYLQVKNLSDRTILSTNVLFGVQSVTMKDKGLTGMYYDTALAAPALADNANSALILGMGTGTYARQLKQYYPKMNITGVEIDQKITDLAGEYFDEPADIPVTTYDGRAWLAASHDKYDVIMVDAYQDITIPLPDELHRVLHHGQRAPEPRRRDGGEHEHDLGRPRFDQRGVERYHRQRVRQWEHTDGRRAEHHEP